MCKGYSYFVAALLFCFITAAFGQTVYFLVSEIEPAYGDSYVLPLTEPNDIAHARDLIAYGPSAGFAIVRADIACNSDCINRDYLSPAKRAWSWHVTDFIGFAQITQEVYDGWPGGVQNNCSLWAGGIGFWHYTITAEFGMDPNHWHRDFNGDTKVDFVDFVPVGNNWENECVQPDWCGGTDLDRNGKVDCNDLKIFAESWLSPFASPPAPVFNCWTWSYQCYGDADNKTEGLTTKYRVFTSDATILANANNTSYPDVRYNPCADFNRDYRVNGNDESILTAHWMKKDTQLQPPCPPYVPVCQQ